MKYELSQTGNVMIQLYDVSGRWIHTIKDQKQTQGNHQIEIRLADLPEGVYFIQLQTPQGQQTLKLIRTNP
ncbi:T9SS type A sorting domain-containing protein [bacterium SCSIO 12643]|nr:T9SS type A sorting domain-containing protein [bacterium SCSIO 12643]